MKLHNRIKGDRVSIRERVEERGGKKVNVYELVIRLGKGKARAAMQRSRLEAAFKHILAEDAPRRSFEEGRALGHGACPKCRAFGNFQPKYVGPFDAGDLLVWRCSCGHSFESECAS